MAVLSAPENKEFLVEKILKSYSTIFDKTNTDRLSQIKRDKVVHPVLFVGMGTCGLIAGAGKTYTAIEKYVRDNQIDAEIVRVGCLGLCSVEPLLDVQLPGKSRISFHHATEEKVEGLLDSVFHRLVVGETVLGQYQHVGHEDWPNIPYIDQLPYFSKQHRNILRNSGIISPYSIDDYIACGGHRSLFKKVFNFTDAKSFEIVDQNELRWGGGGGFPTGKK